MNKEQRTRIITSMMTNLIEIRKVTDIVVHEQTVEFKLRGSAYIAEISENHPDKISVRFRDDYQWAPDIEKQLNHRPPVKHVANRDLLHRPPQKPKTLHDVIQSKSVRRS